MAKIQLVNVNKIYDGNVCAVKDFNLEIDDNEFIVLVGPSGCGKSTALRMIAGLEDISSGDLLIDGIRYNEVKPKNRNIAMVFQSYALYPHMTVAENMAFGLHNQDMKKDIIAKKIADAASILQITEYLERYPRALSGGQRQRVALGRALVRNPRVFLLDEPLSNLDAKLRNEMRTEISKLHKDIKTTFIYVTHDQIEALTMGTKIVVMSKGLIQQVGSPKEIYSKPQNLFVAGFIGSPQMNFLPVNLKESNQLVDIILDKQVVSQIEKENLNNIDILKSKSLVTMGIRPENFFITEDKQTGIKAEVDVVEDLGAELIAYCKVGKEEIIAKLPSDIELTAGQKILLGFDKKDLHLFDTESQKRIIK